MTEKGFVIVNGCYGLILRYGFYTDDFTMNCTTILRGLYDRVYDDVTTDCTRIVRTILRRIRSILRLGFTDSVVFAVTM